MMQEVEVSSEHDIAAVGGGMKSHVEVGKGGWNIRRHCGSRGKGDGHRGKAHRGGERNYPKGSEILDGGNTKKGKRRKDEKKVLLLFSNLLLIIAKVISYL
jgi:hypothetical protein